MINWKVRFRSKLFVTSIVSAGILLGQGVGKLAGFEVPESDIWGIVNPLLSILTIVGIVQDGTTPGLSDSERAMRYE